MNAEKWILVNPDGQQKDLTGHPRHLREVVLLVSVVCEQVAQMLKTGSMSLADSSSLYDLFSAIGITDAGRILISSDEELRRYFKAAVQPCTLSLTISDSDVQATDGNPLFTASEFVTMREMEHNQNSVKVNVGGKQREMSHATADKIPLLAAMLRFPRPQDQPLFIDASPQAFDVLLEVARGRSLKFLDELEPSLKVLVHEYAEYLGMETANAYRFEFRLTAEHPTNKTIINQYSYISHGSTQCTTGVRAQWNTVFGDVQIPQSRQTYWEVEVLNLGGNWNYFMVGVVDASFNGVHNYLDAGNLGWGIHLSGSTINLRANNSNVADMSGSFPIDKGVRIGTLVDVDRGTLMFFLNGVFKVSHPHSMKGRVLFPAFSIYGDTELAIRTGLPAPI